MNVAQGRLDYGPPVAVIDIGSNSVRLVAYEGLTRSPTPIFNEKVLAGLGREVQTTGLLAADAVEKALAALRRFRALCDRMAVAQLWAIATAACRDAKNGKAFVAEAEGICGTKIDVLSGKREGELPALGVVSGFHKPDGIVGDLGGGSLELTEVQGQRIKAGLTLPLGGLALQDLSSKSIKKAEKIVRTALEDARLLEGGKGRTFYAIGGTWRPLARVGGAAHVADRLSAPRHARLCDAGTRSVRVLRSRAPGRSRDALADRGGHRCPPAAAGLRRAGARKPGTDRAAEGHRYLGARRARRPALFDARRRGAREGSADRGRERAQRAALALTRPWRGVDRLDRPLHGVLRARRDRGRAPVAPCGVPSRRHRLAGTSRLSRRAIAQHHRQCRLRRHRSSPPHLHLPRPLLPPCRPG